MACIQIQCPQCGKYVAKPVSHINRAIRKSAPIYCGKKCAGIGRRKHKSAEQKKEEKRLYDAEYRQRDPEKRKQEKADYYQRTRDPKKEREKRKQRMPKHIEYCRRPEYKKYKTEYDRRRNESEYGDFAQAWRLLQELEREIRERASNYEIRVANGYYTRNAQRRRRELWQSRKTLQLQT